MNDDPQIHEPPLEEADLRIALGHLDATLAAWQYDDGLSKVIFAIRAAREWRELTRQRDLLDQWHKRLI